MSKEVKRYFVNPNGPDYLVEMTAAYQAETGFAGLVKGEDYEALLEENKQLRGLYKMHQETETREMRDLRAERDALLAERDGLAKDAERYRWLRALASAQDIRYPLMGTPPEIDKTIDAAMQGAQP
jgi:hypothetical protein